MKKSFGGKDPAKNRSNRRADKPALRSEVRSAELGGKGSGPHKERSGAKRTSRPARAGSKSEKDSSRPRFENANNSEARGTRSRPAAGKKFQGRRDSEKRPEVGATFDGRATSFTHTGEAIVHCGNYVLFVRGAIPGELTRFRIVSAGRRFGRAIVDRVLTPSAHRVMPRCRHFGECGRCALQHVDIREQLHVKEQILRSVLAHGLPNVRLPIAPMIGAASPWGARYKAHFVLGQVHGNLDAKRIDADEFELPAHSIAPAPESLPSDGTPVLAHYRAASREILPIVECPVHDDLANRAAFALLSILKKLGIRAGAQPLDNGADVAKHAIVRVSSSERKSLVLIVASGKNLPGLSELGKSLMELEPTIAGVHLNVNPLPEPVVLGSTTMCLAGESHIRQSILGVQYILSPTSFFQTSPHGAEALVRIAMRAIPPDLKTVLDLYCGVGLFSLPLAKRGHRVIGVEQNPRAIEDAEKAAAVNGIAKCEFHTGKTEELLKKLSRRENIDAVVLDPPRDGCPEWALRIIARGFRPRFIIDVSCDPRSLVRDIDIFLASGYRATVIQPIDMFPQTSQIETVAVFERVHKRGHGHIESSRPIPARREMPRKKSSRPPGKRPKR